MIDFHYGVRLDTIEFDDLEIMRQTRNFSMVNRWCRQCGLISTTEQGRWWEALSGDKTRKLYIIVNSNQERVGVVGLTEIDHLNQRAEFSLLVNPKNQRKGYARAALYTILEHGFHDLNLNIVWGETYEGNPALNLFTSLGMTIDGVRPQHYFKGGKFLDAHMISMSSRMFKEICGAKYLKIVQRKFDDADISYTGKDYYTGKGCVV